MWLLRLIILHVPSLIRAQSTLFNLVSIEPNGIRIRDKNFENEIHYEFTQIVTPSTMQNLEPKLYEIENILVMKWKTVASFTITNQNTECNNYEFKTNSNDSLSVTFNITNLHLYGGGVTSIQQWPVEFLTVQNDTHASNQNHGLLEAIWYTSNGFYVSVHKKVPLFVNINKNELTLTAQRRDPYIRGHATYLTYKVCKYPNVKIAYQRAITDTIGMPSGTPDFRMTQYPIWSTWAQFHTEIDEPKVKEFADSINKYGFPNSQLEIDDNWETCYGSLTPDPKKFPNLKKLVDELKNKGFRVTIWTYPFINLDCEPYYTEALKKGYYVKGRDGTVLSSWWNGNASVIDFTNPEATSWWKERLQTFRKETGVDAFKFDAGESSYSPQPPIFKQMLEDHPDTILKAYVKTVSELGNMSEVRTGRSTQQWTIFVRMNDLTSSWTGNGSLATIIPQLLNMNVIGYPFVIPDMVGGNLYGQKNITAELFVRWLQLNVFMPSIQFSILPWQYDEEVIRLTKKYVNLHAEFAPKIYNLMKRAVTVAAPVNAPLWWVDPDDPVTYTIDSEFLLGDDILVAPVIEEGAISRDIYLPKGLWEDRSDPSRQRDIIVGPVWLRNYSANIEVLPYFVKLPTSVEGRWSGWHVLSALAILAFFLYYTRRRHIANFRKNYEFTLFRRVRKTIKRPHYDNMAKYQQIQPATITIN